MKYQDFAFTLRKTTVKKKPATADDYIAHIKRIFTNNDLKVYDYGFEPEGGLHCHGAVELKDPYIKVQKKFRIRGWRLHLVPLYDMRGWVSYYNKNSKQLNEQVALQEIRYLHNAPELEIESEDERQYYDYVDEERRRLQSCNMFKEHVKRMTEQIAARQFVE